MEDLRLKIGRNLQRMRRERGLSLDGTADLTGVSKAMLGQIERGESNPTVATLWKIAAGLRIPFTSFLEDEEVPVSVVSLGNIKPLLADGGRYRVYPLFPAGRLKDFDLFTVELEPGCSQQSEPHNPGAEEYVMVCLGTLELMLSGDTYTVRQGEAIHFPADRPHAYRNNTADPVRVNMLIHYPARA